MSPRRFVVVHGITPRAAESRAQQIAEDLNNVYCHPTNLGMNSMEVSFRITMILLWLVALAAKIGEMAMSALGTEMVVLVTFGIFSIWTLRPTLSFNPTFCTIDVPRTLLTRKVDTVIIHAAMPHFGPPKNMRSTIPEDIEIVLVDAQSPHGRLPD